MNKVFICLLLLVGTAFTSDEEHHSGSHKPYHRDLSDHEHHEDDEGTHDAKYDHEAFLGKEDAEKFDQLSPEESKQRLGLIVDKIDTDNDGKITEDELQKWIHNIGMQRMKNETKTHFETLEPENGKLSWKKYEERYYLKPEDRSPEGMEKHKENIAKDQKKWKLADQDGDGMLSEKEYLSFLHPEESPHMRDFVIQDAMIDMDKDKDGHISLDEFIRSYWEPTKDEPDEPDYLKHERDSFKNHFDKNKDGRLDLEEVGEWLVPKDYDNSIHEAKHLIEESDANRDGVLTKDEILNKHDLFAGSQATDYGSAMQHEEL